MCKIGDNFFNHADVFSGWIIACLKELNCIAFMLDQNTFQRLGFEKVLIWYSPDLNTEPDK